MDIRSLDLDELIEYLEGLGEKKFRAKQLYRWLHVSLVSSYDEMTNLPATLRERLKVEAPLNTLKVADCQISKLDGTRKYLFELHSN
jgi:23S rRNA (adenine2503-C2)-methyltransferase